MLTGTTTGQRANECLKQINKKKNPKEEGRRVGMGEGKNVRCTVEDGRPCSTPNRTL